MKMFKTTGAVTKYYNTKEEAIADTIRLAKFGIRFASALYEYNSKTDRYVKIGKFRKS